MDRRNFFLTSCAMGVLALGSGSVSASSSEADNKALTHCKWWLEQMFKQMEDGNDVKCINIVEGVGYACMEKHLGTVLPKIKPQIEAAGSDLASIAGIINKDIFQAPLMKADGNELVASWGQCLCPTRVGGYITSPEFCNCTKGFFKAMFEGLSDKNVQVSLEKAIGRGDKTCEVRIKLV
ncbi:MAG: hypothetical protein JW737_08000 [Acidobacteria bacterium]|nr:hypothetical protein [Acidobacteriota bacterium]